MSMFLLVPNSNPDGIKAELLKSGLEYIDVPPNAYFISFRGTSEELSRILGITDGHVGTGVIVQFTSYYGRLPTNIWEWVKSRWES